MAEMVGIQMAKQVDRTAGGRKRIFLPFEFFDQKGEQLG